MDALSADGSRAGTPLRWQAAEAFRLTYRSAKHAGAGQVSIQLTGDHEVLTDQGFIAVEHPTSSLGRDWARAEPSLARSSTGRSSVTVI